MEEVELDNLLYYIDEDNRTATVYRMIDRDYEGRVEIPQCIWDDGHMYEVREIADFAFDGCEGLESIEIPDGIYLVKIKVKTDDMEDIERWLEGEEAAENEQVAGQSADAEPEGTPLPDDNIAQYGTDEDAADGD